MKRSNGCIFCWKPVLKGTGTNYLSSHVHKECKEKDLEEQKSKFKI